MFWPGGEVKMSSSKIIKQAEYNSSDIATFDFGNINLSVPVVATVQKPGSFVPMELFQSSDGSDSPDEEVVDDTPPLLGITEDELNQRINDAFNSGLQEGKELAERGLINVFRTLRASSEMIHNLRDKVLRESEEELINLVMLVARKVIIQEIAQDRSILAGVVKNAIAGLAAREEITVRINPDDYLLITSGRDELLRNELLNDRLTLKPDPSISVGFCLVDASMGTIDASLDGQMDQMYRSLLDQRSAAVVEES